MDLVSVVVDVTQKLQANMYSLMEKCHHQLLRYMCSSVVSGYCSRSRLLPIPVAEEERNTHTHYHHYYSDYRYRYRLYVGSEVYPEHVMAD